MKYLAPLLVLFAVSPLFAYANVVVDSSTYAPPATVNYSGVSNVDFGQALYYNHSTFVCGNDGAIQGWPATSGVLNTDCGAGVDGVGTFDGSTDGDYELLEYFGATCQPGGTFDDYSTCVAAQGSSYHEADFTITEGGGGGGGGGGDFGNFGPGNGLTFGSVWAFSAIILTVVIVSVYLAIFFLILYLIAWPLAYFLRAIKKILYG